MFDKYGFNNLLILAFVLVFALGTNFPHYNDGLGIYFGKQLVSLSIASIGVYGSFIENEILNTSPQIQSIVIALVTQFHLVNTLKDIVEWDYHSYFVYILISTVILSYFLSIKNLTIAERLFRFCFAYSVCTVIVRGIPYIWPYTSIISLIVGILGIFANSLSFNKISIVSSVYIFSSMIIHGIDYFLRSVIHHGWFEPAPDYYYIGLNDIQLAIFFYASYKQLKNENSNQGLFRRDQGYSTFRNSSEPVDAEPV
jgi:hypothetical protein